MTTTTTYSTPHTCIHCGSGVYITNHLNDGWPYSLESGGNWCESDDAIDGRHDEGPAK